MDFIKYVFSGFNKNRYKKILKEFLEEVNCLNRSIECNRVHIKSTLKEVPIDITIYANCSIDVYDYSLHFRGDYNHIQFKFPLQKLEYCIKVDESIYNPCGFRDNEDKYYYKIYFENVEVTIYFRKYNTNKHNIK